MTIAAEDVSFEAHRLVLSACSPYFKSLLTNSKCKHPVIFLKDVTAEHVGLLLKYMYLGQIAVKKQVMSHFIAIFPSINVNIYLGLGCNIEERGPPENQRLGHGIRNGGRHATSQ